MKFGAIIIGSGFGGAITAWRLTQAGVKVLVLERGRRWEPEEDKAKGITAYPRKLEDPWIWWQEWPEKFNGWADFRIFEGMTVVCGAGVGGGSLIYANVSIEPSKTVFKSPWPKEITYAELEEHYKIVGKMLDLQELPDNQTNPRFDLLKEGASKIGASSRWGKSSLAVSFDPKLELNPAKPPTKEASRQFTNKHGAPQGTCYHAGRCDFGCPVKAKNTLDVNYLYLAENKQGEPAEIRPLTIVSHIEQKDNSYTVHFKTIVNGKLKDGSETAELVILAAGSLGSSEILFRSRDRFKTLPNISRFLGQGWSSNGDFLTPALYKSKIYPTVGPTISSKIDFLDGSRDNQSFIIEDGGIPNILKKHMEAFKAQNLEGEHPYEAILDSLKKEVANTSLNLEDHVMPWFANGVDAGNGRYQLVMNSQESRLNLKWDVTRSKPLFQAELDTHKQLSLVTGGTPVVINPFQQLITPHPLGGCNMGSSAADGVVDHRGEVFGYKNLYVIDGATIPTPLGVNPSRTIAAIAERAAKLMIKKA